MVIILCFFTIIIKYKSIFFIILSSLGFKVLLSFVLAQVKKRRLGVYFFLMEVGGGWMEIWFGKKAQPLDLKWVH